MKFGPFSSEKVWFQNRRAKCRKHESQGHSKHEAAILSFDPIGRSIATHRVFGDRTGVGIPVSQHHHTLLHHVMSDSSSLVHPRLAGSGNNSGSSSVPSSSSAICPTTSSHNHHGMITSTKSTFMSSSASPSAGLAIPSLPLHPFPRLIDPTTLLAAQQVLMKYYVLAFRNL